MKMQTFGRITRILIPSIILIIAIYFLVIQTATPEPTAQLLESPTPEQTLCKDCYQGKVTNIIDGDTLVIDNKAVRLALVDAPEFYEDGFKEAREFTQSICPVGLTAIVDVDEKQPTDIHGRTVAVVYCNDKNLNEELIKNNHAKIDKNYCNTSEFSKEEWAIGC